MHRTRFHGVATPTLAAIIGAVPLALFASMAGPVPARTGGFGEMTCQECHWDNPLNETPGQLTLTGIPLPYTPRQAYLITVTLVRPGVSRAGFQLASRFEAGENAGARAGTLRSVDGRTETVQDEDHRMTYLQHSKAGAAVLTPGTAQWTFEWAAPGTGGAVVFHVAGNASDADASPLGDFIYTSTARTEN